jgi:hypothetical protein
MDAIYLIPDLKIIQEARITTQYHFFAPKVYRQDRPGIASQSI